MLEIYLLPLTIPGVFQQLRKGQVVCHTQIFKRTWRGWSSHGCQGCSVAEVLELPGSTSLPHSKTKAYVQGNIQKFLSFYLIERQTCHRQVRLNLQSWLWKLPLQSHRHTSCIYCSADTSSPLSALCSSLNAWGGMSPHFFATFSDSFPKWPIKYFLQYKTLRKSKQRSAYTPAGNDKRDRVTKQVNTLDTVGKYMSHGNNLSLK